MTEQRASESGVVLINVLVVLAIAASVVVLMLTSQEISLARAQRFASASAADALARGAEASAVVALRRDATQAPDSDHYAEAWAQIAQEEATLSTGRFSVEIRDAQARLNINDLAGGSLQTVQIFLRLLDALGLPVSLAPQAVAELRLAGRVNSLDDLTALDPDVRAVLRPYVDALPDRSPVNLNTADPLLLEILFNNPAVARRLQTIRDSAGYLTSQDLARTGAIRPPGTGFKSDVFDITVLAEVDGVDVTLTSRIHRRRGPQGAPQAVVVARRYGPELPPAAADNP